MFIHPLWPSFFHESLKLLEIGKTLKIFDPITLNILSKLEVIEVVE